ncbi:DUF4157 domain-containing protein [Kouleothrix sp.]|uniref:eCIS core domain-containing protein n=1 Tax=Kouleothrix sp. TaxID=2779161 RepID=UPI0039195533
MKTHMHSKKGSQHRPVPSNGVPAPASAPASAPDVAAPSHSFGAVAVTAAPQGAMQPKLAVGAAHDPYEDEGSQVAQRQEAPTNNTGLPDALKDGAESLSGVPLDDVKVHYNSGMPASVDALAYTQASDIYVGPGQEKHLPHEAWHVVQQKQGRVQPTQHLRGVAINDDRALEQEAESMGAKMHSLPAQARPMRKEGPHIQQGISAAIQMAGHEEDLCVVGNWIVKRADKTEIEQYTNRRVPSTAPKFGGPFYTADDARAFLQAHNEIISPKQDEKITKMAEPMARGGKGFMILANVTSGIADPQMRDLKMGTSTADKDDQIRHGVAEPELTAKMIRHEFMDYKSGSSERGYRDEDQWKVAWTGDNLVELKRVLDHASTSALRGVEQDLDSFENWLLATNVVYVGMSILVVVGSNIGRAVPIDFEHPIYASEASFANHKQGIEQGLAHLKNEIQKRLRPYSTNRQGEGNRYITDKDL